MNTSITLTQDGNGDVKKATSNRYKYSFNFTNRTITLSRSFLTALNRDDDEAHKTVMRLQANYPHLAITNKPVGKRTNKSQIKYRKMINFIECLQERDYYMEMFAAIRKASKGNPSPYNYVRDWFFQTFAVYHDRFPEFDEEWKIVVQRKGLVDEIAEKRQEEVEEAS